MLTPQERQLLERLLRRAYPTEAQRATIAQLQRQAGIPIEPGEASRRVQERIQRQRTERAILASQLGEPGQPSGMRYQYERIIEVLPSRMARRSRYITIRVESLVRLSGPALEEVFRLQIIEFRRRIRYRGPIWFVSPEEIGRPHRPLYVDYPGYFDYTDFFDFPDDIPDEPYYPES